MMDIYIDIDAHEVFPQVLHVAQRHALELYVLTRDYLDVDANVHLILAEERQSNRGAWIENNILRGDICITGDPGIATNCIRRGALALTPLGGHWPSNISSDVARHSVGSVTDRRTPDSRLFIQRLERVIATQGVEWRSFATSRGMPRETAASSLSRPGFSRMTHG